MSEEHNKKWSGMMRRLGARVGPREGPGGTHRYKMKERLISIGDDYPIENESGTSAFYVDGKALRLRNTLIIKDMQGHDLYRIQERMLRIKDTMEIEKGGGGEAATIKKALITPLRERWTVHVPGGPDMEVQGNLLDHEYRIERGREKIAEVSKKWFRLRDTYGVEVAPGQDDALILAIAVAIDQMAH
jgi:uncharacterized protein YxjI